MSYVYHVSYITCHISHVIYHMSYILYHISHVIYHMSYIMYHVSHITCHISCIIYHINCTSLKPNGLWFYLHVLLRIHPMGSGSHRFQERPDPTEQGGHRASSWEAQCQGNDVETTGKTRDVHWNMTGIFNDI